jgi:hypothetical protein
LNRGAFGGLRGDPIQKKRMNHPEEGGKPDGDRIIDQLSALVLGRPVQFLRRVVYPWTIEDGPEVRVRDRSLMR